MIGQTFFGSQCQENYLVVLGGAGEFQRTRISNIELVSNSGAAVIGGSWGCVGGLSAPTALVLVFGKILWSGCYFVFERRVLVCTEGSGCKRVAKVKSQKPKAKKKGQRRDDKRKQRGRGVA